MKKLKDVTRLEVIDYHTGRVLVKYNVEVETSLQDDGRTFKIFYREENEPKPLSKKERAKQYIADCDLDISSSDLIENYTECDKCGYWLPYGEDCLCWTR